MNKLIYNPHQLSILDLSFGPTKFARNDLEQGPDDSDPHAFRMSSYKRIFRETWEEVAEKTGLDVADPRVRAESRTIVRRDYFEPDVRAYQKEHSGVLEYENEREFTVINREVTYLTPDGNPSKFTFTSFHERQLNDKSQEIRQSYSQTAHRLDLLAQSTIVSATGPIEVTKIAHDKKGVRDVYTFIYDPAENRGKIKIRNLAPDGKFFTPDQAQQRIARLFPDATQIRMDNGVSVLVKSQSVDTERVAQTYTQIVHEKIVAIQKQTPVHDSVEQALRFPTEVAGHVVDNTAETLQGVRASIERYIQKRREEREVMGDKQSTKEQPISEEIGIVQLLTNEKFVPALAILSTEPDVLVTKDVELRVLWKKKAEETLGISSEESVGFLDDIERMWEVMSGAKEIIFLVEQDKQIQEALFPVFFIALNEIAHPEEMVSRKQKVVKESPEVALSPEEQESVYAFFTSQEDSLGTLVLERQKKEFFNLEQADITVLFWVKELINNIDQDPGNIVMEKIKHQEELALLQMSALWEIFTGFMKSDMGRDVNEDKSKSGVVSGTLENAQIQNLPPREREAVEDFTMALTVWFLLKFYTYYQSLEGLKGFVSEFYSPSQSLEQKKQPVGLLAKLKDHIPEGLVQKDITQWILFTIIWYLAQQREAGYIGSTATSQTLILKSKHKKKKSLIKISLTRSALALQGLLYTFT